MEQKKKEIISQAINVIIAVLSAVLTTLGLNSCI